VPNDVASYRACARRSSARRREDLGAAARVFLLPGDVELLTAKAERQGLDDGRGLLLCQGQEAGAVELVTLDQGGGDALPGRLVLGQEVGGPLPGQHDHVHPLVVGEVWILGQGGGEVVVVVLLVLPVQVGQGLAYHTLGGVPAFGDGACHRHDSPVPVVDHA